MQPLSWTTALPAHGTAAACSAASFAAGAGLLLAGRHLAGQGRGAAAACCFALGAAGLSAELATLVFLRRK